MHKRCPNTWKEQQELNHYYSAWLSSTGPQHEATVQTGHQATGHPQHMVPCKGHKGPYPRVTAMAAPWMPWKAKDSSPWAIYAVVFSLEKQHCWTRTTRVANGIQSNTAPSLKFVSPAFAMNLPEQTTAWGWSELWGSKARGNLTNSINFSSQVLRSVLQNQGSKANQCSHCTK